MNTLLELPVLKKKKLKTVSIFMNLENTLTFIATDFQ